MTGTETTTASIPVMPPKNVKPGDWFVVNTGGDVSSLIQFAEWMSDKASGVKDPAISMWDHAGMCTEVKPDGTVMIAEAEPGGAREVPWHYQGKPFLWSTGIIDMPAAAGAAARKYTRPGPWGKTGVPYSALDYLALTTHSLHIPVPGLAGFIANSNRMICSQLVDKAALDAGKHLFSDGRYPGYVKPSDLGWLLVTRP